MKDEEPTPVCAKCGRPFEKYGYCWVPHQLCLCNDFVIRIRDDGTARMPDGKVVKISDPTPLEKLNERIGQDLREKHRQDVNELKRLLRYVTYLRLPLGDTVFDHLDFQRQKIIHDILNER